MEHLIKILLLKFWMFFIFSPHILLHASSQQMGTLIVTYQTDQKGSRLDRIRFWLINAQNERTLYPQKDESVSNTHTPNERTVVISQLPIGNYRIEFLVPNTDRLFEDIGPKHIHLAASSVIKVDQSIRLRSPSHAISKDTNELALMMNHYHFPFSSISQNLPYPNQLSYFSLYSNRQTHWQLLQKGKLIYSGAGSISNLSVFPGKHYMILAENPAPYHLYVFPNIYFNLLPGQNLQAQLIYRH